MVRQICEKDYHFWQNLAFGVYGLNLKGDIASEHFKWSCMDGKMSVGPGSSRDHHALVPPSYLVPCYPSDSNKLTHF